MSARNLSSRLWQNLGNNLRGSRFTQVAQLTTEEKSLTREFEDIQIPVPWGYVAGKWYGPKDVRPLVGLHGWQDNAGTFDTIAPLLPSHLGFLALDLPGHGMSSRLPDGCAYHAIDYVQFMVTLMKHYNWDKLSIIAHSMSSVNSFVFTSLFPEKVDLFVSLDVLKPLIKSPQKTIEALCERMQTFVVADERNRAKSEPPSYTYEELIERLHLGSNKSIDRDCCEYLLNRNIEKSSKDPNKYFFRRDSRLKSMIFTAIPQETVVEMARRITVPHLFIKAESAPYYENKKYYDEVLAVLKLRPNFKCYHVEGKHHVHLNEPKKISEIVNPFILKHRPT